MKKLIARLAALTAAGILLLTGCENIPRETAHPPFYKVVDSDTGGTVYLLGTMHTAPKNCALPNEVYDALDECETLAVEIDLLALDKDSERLSSAMEILKLPEGTAKDALGEDYGEIRDFFEKKGLYNAVYEQYIPSVWSSAITNKLADDAGYSSDCGTDRMLLDYAKRHFVEIRELESVESQYEMNSREPMALQIYLLKQSVESDYEAQKSSLTRLYDAWRTGDTAALEAMMYEDEIPEELSDEYEYYLAEMYENRQRAMSDKIVDYLKKGEKVFVAVGALHFAAAPDIPDFLKEAGYEIRSIEYAGE